MAIFLSNGADVGGSGSYVPGTQSVQFIHDNFAATGDTIQLPNGIFTWLTGASLTKAVIVSSQNFRQATIQPGNIGPSAHMLSVQKSANIAYTQPSSGAHASVRITGINFVATTSSNIFKFINITEGAGAESVSAAGKYQISTLPALVDNNTFLCGPVLSGQLQFGAIDCMANGAVFAWNIFANSNNTGNAGSNGGFDAGGIECHNPGGSPIAPSWQSFDSMGINDTNGNLNVYIEQNTWNGLMDQAIDHADHSRVVVRNNTFNASGTASHGQDSGPSGGRHIEIYDNTFVFPTSGPINYAGAQSVAFTGSTSTLSQIITGISSTAGIVNNMTIVGTGIPANSTVTGVTANTVTINNFPTQSGTFPLTAYYTYPTNVANWYLHRAATGLCTGNTMPDISSSTWGNKNSIVFGVFNTCTGPNSIPCQGNYPTSFLYPAARQVGQTWIGAAVSGFPPHRFNGDTSQTGGTTAVDGPTDAQFAAGIGYVTDPFYVWNNTPVGANWSIFGTLDQSATVGSACTTFCNWINANHGSGCSTTSGYNPNLATNYIQSGRDVVYAAKLSGPTGTSWTRYTFPHPLNPGQPGGNITPMLSGNANIAGVVNPIISSGGLTASTEVAIVRTLVGATGGYTIPTNNFVSLYSTQFSSARAGATEWTDVNYARQAMGASAAGWTIAAYANGVGVVWKNTNLVLFPSPLASQVLFSVGFCDALTSGNIDFFIDLSSVTVATGINVTLPASTGAVFTTY